MGKAHKSLLEVFLDVYLKKTTTSQTSIPTQTEEGPSSNLSEKLQKLEETFSASKKLTYNDLESKMNKYKLDYDRKMKEQLAREVQRIKEVEISNVRLEESNKMREKINQSRQEMEKSFREKLESLKERERNFNTRVKDREREIERYQFDHRQGMLNDIENIKLKEKNLEDRVKVEADGLRCEKENFLRKKEEVSEKLTEIAALKTKLKNEQIEDMELYKRQYDRAHEEDRNEIKKKNRELDDQEFSLNRKALEYERSQEENHKLKDALSNLEKKMEDFITSNKDYKEEIKSMRDQLKNVAESGKRDQEIIGSKTTENNILKSEIGTLKSLQNEQKSLTEERKEEHEYYTKGLKTQLEQNQEYIKQMEESYAKQTQAQERLYKTQLDQEKNEKAKTLAELENEKDYLQSQVEGERALTREMRKLKNTKEAEENLKMGEISSSLFESAHAFGPEYMLRKQKALELDKETESIKWQIKNILNPETPALIENPLPSKLNPLPFSPHKLHDEYLYTPQIDTAFKTAPHKQPSPHPNHHQQEKEQEKQEKAKTSHTNTHAPYEPIKHSQTVPPSTSPPHSKAISKPSPQKAESKLQNPIFKKPQLHSQWKPSHIKKTQDSNTGFKSSPKQHENVSGKGEEDEKESVEEKKKDLFKNDTFGKNIFALSQVVDESSREHEDNGKQGSTLEDNQNQNEFIHMSTEEKPVVIESEEQSVQSIESLAQYPDSDR